MVLDEALPVPPDWPDKSLGPGSEPPWPSSVATPLQETVVPVMHPWRVTINRKYDYSVEAINSAEASHQAVWTWRKDEAVRPDERLSVVEDLHVRIRRHKR